MSLVLLQSVAVAQNWRDILTKKPLNESEIRDYFGDSLKLIENPQLKPGQVIDFDSGSFRVNGSLREGVGAYVYDVSPVSNPEQSFALKMPKLGKNGGLNIKSVNGYIRETEIINNLDHPGVIKSVRPDSHFLVMEKADGTFLDLMKSLKYKPQAPKFAVKALEDVESCLNYLRPKGIAYKDLHTGNIVYFKTEDNRIEFKLIDFEKTVYSEANDPDVFEKIFQQLAEFIQSEDAEEFEQELFRAVTVYDLKDVLRQRGITIEEFDGQLSGEEQMILAVSEARAEASGGAPGGAAGDCNK